MSASLGNINVGTVNGSTFFNLQAAGDYFIDGYMLGYVKGQVTAQASSTVYLNTLNNSANRVLLLGGALLTAAATLNLSSVFALSDLRLPWNRGSPIWIEVVNDAATTSFALFCQLYGRQIS